VRENRNHAILERLEQLGVPVEWDDVVRRAGGTVGRPHIAEAMVARGHCVDRNDAFARYLADDAPAYVPTSALTPEQAVSLIAESGGAAVLAHPAHLHLAPHALADYVDRLVAAGLRGIEAYRPEHEPELRAELAGLAARRGLAATAGSDFHQPPVTENPDLGETGPVPAGYDPLPALRL
jgi:predicted metal-dependent phosphoesterase TrpH